MIIHYIFWHKLSVLFKTFSIGIPVTGLIFAAKLYWFTVLENADTQTGNWCKQLCDADKKKKKYCFITTHNFKYNKMRIKYHLFWKLYCAIKFLPRYSYSLIVALMKPKPMNHISRYQSLLLSNIFHMAYHCNSIQ